MLTRILSLLTLVFSLSLADCSAFQVRHTDEKGATRTYVTDTIFVGTGTFVDCAIAPVYFTFGLLYVQPYIHVRGGTIAYPSLLGSGCLGFRGGNPANWVGIGFFNEGAGNQASFMDLNQKEMSISGGSIEVTRVADRIHFTPR